METLGGLEAFDPGGNRAARLRWLWFIKLDGLQSTDECAVRMCGASRGVPCPLRVGVPEREPPGVSAKNCGLGLPPADRGHSWATVE